MAKALSDQIRDAVRGSKMGHNEISRIIGIDKGSFSKFMAGKRGVSLAALDKLAALLKLRIVVERKEG